MKKYFNYLTLSFIALFFSLTGKAQSIPQLPGAMFTEIQTDARAAALGGTANITEASAMGVFSNPSANLFTENKWLLGGNLSTLNKEGGNNLIAIGGHYNLGRQHGLSIGLRHYGYKSIDIINSSGNNDGKFTPKELTIDLGYGYRFTENLAFSLTARYISSDMGAYLDSKSANAFAADIGLTYRGEMNAMDGGSYSIALSASNFGSKLKYNNNADGLSLPTTVKAGGSIKMPFNDDHIITAVVNAGYRVLPSDFSGFEAGLGAEYNLYKHGFLRAGYHISDQDKGLGNFATLGAGIAFNPVKLDISYWSGVSDQDYKNILFISLSACF